MFTNSLISHKRKVFYVVVGIYHLVYFSSMLLGHLRVISLQQQVVIVIPILGWLALFTIITFFLVLPNLITTKQNRKVVLFNLLLVFLPLVSVLAWYADLTRCFCLDLECRNWKVAAPWLDVNQHCGHKP